MLYGESPEAGAGAHYCAANSRYSLRLSIISVFSPEERAILHTCATPRARVKSVPRAHESAFGVFWRTS